MKEITKAVNSAIAAGDLPDCEAFRQSAKDWASFALETYTDAFLAKALSVSKAIAEFCAVIEKDAPQEH